MRCRVVRDGGFQSALQSPNMIEEFRYISERRTGVYMVRNCDCACVDHALVLDSNDNAMIYSVESYAFLISSEVIEKCGGVDAKNLRVREVRMIEGRD